MNGKTGLAPYLGHTNWQIPTTTGSTGNWNPNCSYTPKSPNAPAYGYTCNGPQNQLGELFYDQLGGQAGHELAQTANQDAALFNDVQNNYYWENGPTNPFSGGLPSFSFQSGYSGEQTLVNALDVFLELPGDAIPEPKPIATFLTAIALLTTTLLVARVKPGTTAKSSNAADRRPAETHATGSKRFFF